MTMLKTVRFQYGQIPMQYEIQHCTMREGENADPEMVRIHECEIKSERFFDLYQSPTSPTVDFIRASGKGTLTICLFNNHQVSAICSLFGHVLPKLTRSEVSESVTGKNCCCLIAVRRSSIYIP